MAGIRSPDDQIGTATAIRLFVADLAGEGSPKKQILHIYQVAPGQTAAERSRLWQDRVWGSKNKKTPTC